jgi:hypothetical protein
MLSILKLIICLVVKIKINFYVIFSCWEMLLIIIDDFGKSVVKKKFDVKISKDS